MAEDTSSTLEQGDNPQPRISLGQVSYNGLHVLGGQIVEESQRDLRFPYCVRTYKEMMKDSTIAPALSLVKMTIAGATWTIKIPEGYEDQLKDHARFLEQNMNDMEHTWNEVITQMATHSKYGFSLTEKVFRRRLKSKGSKYNDRLIGLADLVNISQDSVVSWNYSPDGRKITGITQKVNIPRGLNQSGSNMSQGSTIDINRSKYIHVRADPEKDNPEGTSVLNYVYKAWRFKTALEDFESMGVSKDLRGLRVMSIPSRFLSPNASDEDKQVAEYYKQGMSNLSANEQSSVIIPSDRDEKGNPLFDFELKSVMGQKSYDTNTIIERFRKEIVTGVLAPQLILGQSGGGSFSLASSLSNLTATVVNTRLKEIKDQLNHDLIPQLFELNGWNTEVTPYFDYGNVDPIDLDILSKFFQRIAAVGLIPKTPDVVNYITDQLGIDKQFTGLETPEEIAPSLTGYTSGSGEGLESGLGSGTSKTVSSRDNTTANTED